MDTHRLPDGLRPTRCPQCSAIARGDVAWCLVCYAPFAAEQVPDPGRHPDAARAPQAPPAAIPRSRQDVDAVADRLLAELAATGRRAPWPPWLPVTRGGRAVLATGLLAGSSGALLAVMSVLGHLL